ncbi:MAG: diguanylate cyclase (GGDEF)-like protein, partial [Paraglaciecola sp.]
GGLNKWQAEDMAALNNHFTHYNSFNGLPSSHIYAILDNNMGELWLSSTAGLTRLNPKSGKTRNFDTSEGLKDSEFNFGAGFKDSQGIMYFGGNSGFVRFDPDDIKDSKFIPPMELVRIKILNEQVWFDVPYQELQGLVLDYTDHFISFEFAALDFNSPEKREYRYKLEGLDPNWIALGHSRLATFTNLPAGKYILKVQASSNQGLWNTQGIILPIRMLPPPWGTWWAYSLYTLLMGLILWCFVWLYWQKRQLKIQQITELEAKVEERTSELKQANDNLASLAYFDPLTTIPNRRFFIVQTDRLIHACQRREHLLAIGLLDFDDFKLINDNYGHTTGDEVLSALGACFKDFFRKDDTYCRWGGDEFAFSVVSPDVTGIEDLCHRLLSSITKFQYSVGKEIKFSATVSIGVCIRLPKHKDSLDGYMKIADSALYSAKAEGKNRVSFSIDTK